MSNGPDFTHCGRPIEWADQSPISDEFAAAVATARNNLNVEIELCRWSVDDSLGDEYANWWVKQRTAVRRHAGNLPHADQFKLTTHRRVDKGDGFVKCYVRFDRVRVIKAVAA
jgi:hypothetical protein